MKKSIFNIILILTFCFTVFAQTDETSCQKIIVEHPGIVYTKTTFEVSASYEKTNSPETSLFNWIIINKDKVTKIKQKKVIKITSKDSEEVGTITVLAEPINKECNNTALIKIHFLRPIGSPLIFDDYEKIDWKDEKLRLDNAYLQIIEMPDQELLIIVDYDSELEKNLKNYLFRIAEYLSNRKLQKNRIKFLIAPSEQSRTKLQPFPLNPRNYDVESFYENYLIIKGEDLEKLAKMFK